MHTTALEESERTLITEDENVDLSPDQWGYLKKREKMKCCTIIAKAKIIIV